MVDKSLTFTDKKMLSKTKPTDLLSNSMKQVYFLKQVTFPRAIFPQKKVKKGVFLHIFQFDFESTVHFLNIRNSINHTVQKHVHLTNRTQSLVNVPRRRFHCALLFHVIIALQFAYEA